MRAPSRRWRRHGVTALLAALSLSRASSAQAEPDAPATTPAPVTAPVTAPSSTGTAATTTTTAPAPASADLAPEQRGDPAQFRGRTAGRTAGEVLLWIPRVALAPLHVVTELTVRLPIYAGAEFVDRHHLVPLLDEVFHPTPDISWSPSVSLDLGAISFFGVQARIRNLGVPGHEVRLLAETGGIDAWNVDLRDRWQLGSGMFAGVRGGYVARPDRAFFGLGPRSGGERTNFAQTRYEAFAFAGFERDNHLRVELSQGYRGEVTARGYAPSVDTRFPIDAIPGFGELQLAVAMLDVKVDTRRIREENGGFRVLAGATYARDVRVPERTFLTAALDLEGGVEVSAPDRVLAARAYVMETFPLGDEPVPFTHQAMLGWENHHGFLWGRFRGESAVLGEIHYRYPIGYFVDAQWTASAANVFARDFSDFSFGALTGSLGLGLRTRRTGHTALELTFALGTSRFDEPFAFNAVRVYFASSEGL